MIKLAKDYILNEFEKMLNQHRQDNFITCPDNCFCWDIDNKIQYLRHKE